MSEEDVTPQGRLKAAKRRAFEKLRAQYPGEIKMAGTIYQVAVQLPDVTLQTPREGPVEMRGAVFLLDKLDHPAEPVIQTLLIHEGLEYSLNRQTSRSSTDIAWRLLCIQRHTPVK